MYNFTIAINPGHHHSWQKDPVAWHCAWKGCKAVTTNPRLPTLTTYPCDTPHNAQCSCIRMYGDSSCVMCGNKRMELVEGAKVCHVCNSPTELCCSDCRINFHAKIYVCGKFTCMEAHERKCK